MACTDDGYIHETFDRSRAEIWLDITGVPAYEAIVQCWRTMRERWACAASNPGVLWQLRMSPLLHHELFHRCDGVTIDGLRVPVVSDHLIPAYTAGDQGDEVTSDIWIDLLEREDGDET